jgi:hypothetical protein
MAGPKARSSALVAALICVLALLAACGSSTPVSQPAADQITGAASCPAAESEDLTFSGALKGHVSCSTSPALCSTLTGTPSIVVPLNARVGSTAVQLLIAFSFWQQGAKTNEPGTYAAGRLGDAADSTHFGATLDGFGHWETPTPGGSMTLATDTAAAASGSVDIKLTSGNKTLAVAGSWHCVKRS